MQPGTVMAQAIQTLAKKSPQYCNGKGLGFWPIPTLFPLLLTHTLLLLQTEISRLYLEHDPLAARLTHARTQFSKLSHEGDLGENHTELFLADHPEVRKLTPTVTEQLPFADFCRGMLALQDFAELCGAITDNEIGSVEEARALQDARIVVDGPYLQKHLVEEVEHAKAAEKINQIFLTSPYNDRFTSGIEKHRQLYLRACS